MKTIIKPKKQKTKLQVILKERSMNQSELIKLIEETTGRVFLKSNISKIITGSHLNYGVKDAIIISTALGLKVEDITEFEIAKESE